MFWLRNKSFFPFRTPIWGPVNKGYTLSQGVVPIYRVPAGSPTPVTLECQKWWSIFGGHLPVGNLLRDVANIYLLGCMDVEVYEK